MSFFKDDPVLSTVAIAPASPKSIPGGGATVRAAEHVYNRAGGLLTAVATRIGADLASILAVWIVESSGDAHVVNHAIIRFENHKFFDNWGDDHTAKFDDHFQFGGRAGVTGKRWENHKFRDATSKPFAKFHGDQAKEYAVLTFARTLDDTAALKSISIGGSQILISNFKDIGYADPQAMYNAFQANERAHFLGFLDFCKKNGCVDNLVAHDWTGFASVYNGASNAAAYGAKMRNAFDALKPHF